MTNLPRTFTETLAAVRAEGHTAAACGGNADIILLRKCAGVAQSVWRLATDCTIRGSTVGGSEVFLTPPDWTWSLPSLLYNGY